jgi:dihydropteroate synthase
MARALPPARGRPIARTAARLRGSLQRAAAAGIEQVTVDPGIGFTVNAEIPAADWNLQLLRDLADLRRLGRPILVGVSRKTFIGRILGQPDPADRLTGSLAATAVAVANGTHIVRTHDVAATRQAMRVAEAIRRGSLPLPE